MKTNKARASFGVLLLAGMLGMTFLYAVANLHSGAGVSANTVSAQPGPVVKPIPAQPTDPLFMKIEGVEGESQDREHMDWIELLSFSQGQYLSPSSTAPGGATRGTLIFEELAVKKTLDKSSPKLAEACCNGTIFPKVEIHLTRPIAGGAPLTYCTFELKKAIVASYHIEGSTQDVVPNESLSLNFEEIKVVYTQFDSAGRPKGTVQYSWNIKANRPV